METSHVMLRVTEYVMRFAPVGVFGSVAGTIATHGLGMLLVFGKFLLGFYIALAALWVLLIGAGYLVLGKDVFRLLSLIRGPVLVGFFTASSESTCPSSWSSWKNSASSRVSRALCCLWVTRSTSMAP
jgi:Na+/H+-dicarboxylate symporter